MTGSLTSHSSMIGIRASAGSGKTYRLTTEYLRIFFAGADAETILATTFTRTAAAEILGRVLHRMAEACVNGLKLAQLAQDLQLDLDTQTVQNHLRRFCRSLDQVAIGTIDSFFSGISACHKYEVDQAIGGSIYDERSTAAKRLRIEALRTVLSHPDWDAILSTIDRLQGGTPGRSVVSSLDDTLCELLKLYQTTKPEHWAVDVYESRELDDTNLEAALTALMFLECPHKHRSFVAGMEKVRDLAIEGKWNEFLASTLIKAVETENYTFYGKNLSNEMLHAYAPLINHAQSLAVKKHAEKTEATYRLLELLSPEYNKLRIAQGMAFHSDVPIALSKLMEVVDEDELAYRLNRRINHLLLDEFQDTDPHQYKILSPFTDQIDHLAGAQGSVFWVGDMKQAIYGWRGARSAIFGQLEQKYPDIVWNELSTSYRSSQIILDSVNQVFDGLQHSSTIEEGSGGEHFETVYNWCKQYIPHTAQFDLPGYVSIIESPSVISQQNNDDEMEGDDEKVLTGGQTYVQYAARRVAIIQQQAPGCSIGVLTRSNEMADNILFELRRLGVPAAALGGSPLLSDPAAALVLAVLSLADRPSDRYAAFRVLNSPLAPVLGLTSLVPWHLNEVSMRIRAALATDGYALTFVNWTKVLALECDARGARRLAYLVELADDFDQTPGLRPRDFLDKASDSGCSDSSTAPVQVMSIHKAKGLEFDCVVLPELHKKLFAKTPLVLTYTDEETLEVTGVTRYAGKDLASMDNHLSDMYYQYRKNIIDESLCLLYVAMTRARYSVTIIAPPVVRKSLTLMALLRDKLCSDEHPQERDGSKYLYSHGDSDWFDILQCEQLSEESTIEAAKALDTPRSISEVGRRIEHHSSPSSMEGWEHVRVEQIIGSESREGRRTGSIIHSFFQQVGWIEDGVPDSETLVQGAKLACPDASSDRIRHEAKLFEAMILSAGVISALQRPALLTGETVDLWRERKFATFLSGKYVVGIFDRVVIESQNGKVISAHLLDYKTSDLSKSTPAAEAEKYKAQIETYRDALSQILGLPPASVTACIFFPAAGVSVTVPLPAVD